MFGWVIVSWQLHFHVYYQSALGPRGGLRPFSLCVIHNEGVYPSSGDINGLIMTMIQRESGNIELRDAFARFSMSSGCSVFDL
jgi:hypothetical protein